MDRQGKVAVAVAIIVLIGWQIYYARTYKPPVPSVQPTATPAAIQSPALAVPQSAEATTTLQPNSAGPEKAVPEQTKKFTSPSVEYVFTNLGGGIQRTMLLNHLAENDRHVTLNEYGAIPIGAISDRAGMDANLACTVNGNADGSVTCERTTPEQVRITKKFTLPSSSVGQDQFLVSLDVTFANQGAQNYRTGGYYIYLGSAAPIHKGDLPTYTGLDWYRNGTAKDVNVMWFNAGKIPIVGIQTSPEKADYTAEADNITWAGVYSQYFTTILSASGNPADRVWGRRFNAENDGRSVYGIDGALGMPGFKLGPGEKTTQHFSMYLGPRQYQLLKKLGDGQDAIMQFGTFGIVSKALLKAMNWLKGVLGSYWAAILVLTLCIKSIMWPLQNRATQSMKKMQALTPKMNELKEKYKDDPTRMNQETMKLYKEYNINPLSGCLPMFIQIPIFFGFYRMLGTAIELRNSRFLWVHDLSQPDTVAHLPGVGWPVNILPLCMAATMLWQMRLSPKSGDQAQQKIFMFMPLIFIAFCYNYASALALYWTVQNLFSIVQLYVTRNQGAPALQKIATAVSRKKR
jgi:YidC/Oxa1 family membrane protein insertase